MRIFLLSQRSLIWTCYSNFHLHRQSHESVDVFVASSIPQNGLSSKYHFENNMKAYSEERKLVIADKFNAGMSLGDIKKISAKLENPKILL